MPKKPNPSTPPAAPVAPVVQVNPYLGRFQPLPLGKPGVKCPITGRCRSSIYNDAARGDIRLVKLNGKVYIDVEHWLARMQAQPTLAVKRALPTKAQRASRAA